MKLIKKGLINLALIATTLNPIKAEEYNDLELTSQSLVAENRAFDQMKYNGLKPVEPITDSVIEGTVNMNQNSSLNGFYVVNSTINLNDKNAKLSNLYLDNSVIIFNYNDATSNTIKNNIITNHKRGIVLLHKSGQPEISDNVFYNMKYGVTGYNPKDFFMGDINKYGDNIFINGTNHMLIHPSTNTLECVGNAFWNPNKGGFAETEEEALETIRIIVNPSSNLTRKATKKDINLLPLKIMPEYKTDAEVWHLYE